MKWELKHPRVQMEMLGYIPQFLDESDPRPAKEQIEENYAHGGGWRPIKGFSANENSIQYDDYRPRVLIAETKLRKEVIRIYEGALVGIFQPDGEFEIACLD